MFQLLLKAQTAMTFLQHHVEILHPVEIKFPGVQELNSISGWIFANC